ncbi:hypothetical protein VIGAN_09207100 [Vigna angularis var. angularis]|uniref:Uncharacterized protein n=1 Tax=Vigna angularis var. angularis TaxID=157739 RepID=A0A0S3T021_PHAAN|nr:hypothetical protein VIGAN_09207100 [Vigna angularis var. angularis]
MNSFARRFSTKLLNLSSQDCNLMIFMLFRISEVALRRSSCEIMNCAMHFCRNLANGTLISPHIRRGIKPGSAPTPTTPYRILIDRRICNVHAHVR